MFRQWNVRFHIPEVSVSFFLTSIVRTPAIITEEKHTISKECCLCNTTTLQQPSNDFLGIESNFFYNLENLVVMPAYSKVPRLEHLNQWLCHWPRKAGLYLMMMYRWFRCAQIYCQCQSCRKSCTCCADYLWTERWLCLFFGWLL